MRKPPIRLSVLLLLVLGGAGLAQEKKETSKAELKITPEEVQRHNPVKPTPASLAEGKRVYGYDCAVCHGKDGDGKGELVESMKLKLRNYRESDALKNFTDGELFYIISKGKGDMPGEEGRMKPEECWQLVNYIRSLAKKESPPKQEKPE